MQAFLGLTVACARCHDHKFDPIPMRDYYAIAGILRSTQVCYGTIPVIQNIHPTPLLPLAADSEQPVGTEKIGKLARAKLVRDIETLEKKREELRKEKKLFTTREGVQTTSLLAISVNKRDSYDEEGNPKLLAMGVRERTVPRDSELFLRGEVSKPGAKVPRGMLQVLPDGAGKIREGSGRLELAEWIASKDNPLVARVMVNRVWAWLFGRGLVTTPDNFGSSGQRPTHPELLDHLSVWFMENGWSVKKLVRHLTLSRAYQLASTHDARNHDADPDNAHHWRMSKRRLEAESLRDAMLFVAGELDMKPPRTSLVAKLGDGFAQTMLRFGAYDERVKTRAVYLPVVRDQHLDALALFDFADPSVVVGERAVTTVPSQTLYLMNNTFVQRTSEAAARRLYADKDSDSERIRLAYVRFFGRAASDKEVQNAETFLSDYAKILESEGKPKSRQRSTAWVALCQALMGSAEFLYR